MDFPDPIHAKPTRTARPTTLVPGHAVPTSPRHAQRDPIPVVSIENELATQTEILRFMAGWVLAGSLFVVMSTMIGLIVGGFVLFVTNPILGVVAVLVFLLLLLLTLYGVSVLRRLVFSTLKIRA